MADDTVTITRAELAEMDDMLTRQAQAIATLWRDMPGLNGDALKLAENELQSLIGWLARQKGGQGVGWLARQKGGQNGE